MYKLVAIDLDGTLLNSFGEVTENTKNVLLEAKEKVVTTVNAAMVAAYWLIGKQYRICQNTFKR